MDRGGDIFFDAFPEPCAVIDRQGGILALNPKAQEVFGTAAPVRPEDMASLAATLAAVAGDGAMRQVALRDAAGTLHLWQIHPPQDGKGFRAILRCPVAEAAPLLETAAVEAVSGVGSWSYDLQSGEVRWSDQTYRLHDLEPGGPVPPETPTFDFFTEPSRTTLAAAVERAVSLGEPYDLELEMVTPAGRRTWVRATGAREERTGRPPRLFGTFQDITAKRQERDILRGMVAQRDRERRRLIATLEALPDDLFELDRAGRFIDFHSRSPDRLSLPPDRFLGRRMEDVLPPEVAAIGRQAIAQIDATGQSSGLRYEIDGPEGRRWFELSGARRYSDDGGYMLLARDVTQRVLDEAALQASDALMRTFFELSPVGITIADLGNGRLIDANPALLQATGLTLQDLRDRYPGRIVSSPDHVLRRQIAASLEREGRFGPLAAECFRADDSTFPVRMNGVRVRDASGRTLLWTLIEDMREQHALEERLRAAERFAVMARQQLQSAVESLSEGLVIFDADDRLVLANDSYRRIYAESAPVTVPGTRFEEIVRFCLAQGDYPEAEGREEEFFAERMAQHRAANATSEQRLRDGRVVRIRESRTPDGGRVGLHVVVTDIHEARRAAEEANRTKSAFLAHMSHEIRTPLAGILGITDLLMERIVDPGKRELAEALRQSGETLLTILNDILDVSKIEAGKMELEASDFRPDDLARTVAALYELRAESRNLTFRLDLGAGADRPLRGDPHRISQILHNLLSNALKFTERGGITLAASADRDWALVLRVEDSGIGMTREQSLRMMRPFEQASADMTRRFGGTGLGMSIVLRLVDMMGGRIEVDSRYGRGTAVTVTLPLPPAAEALPQPAPAEAGPDRHALTGLRVLAADDNEINRRILKGFLESMGSEVTLAEDGRQALDRWEPDRFDVLCLDISMPVLDGIGALHLIRAKAEAQGAAVPPAVAITSNAMTEQVAAYLAAGFDAHVGKPFRKADLAAALSRLGRPAALRTAALP